MDRMVAANTVGPVLGLESVPSTPGSRNRDSCDAPKVGHPPPDKPDLAEGFTRLFQLNPADARPNDQINRALQTILDPLP